MVESALLRVDADAALGTAKRHIHCCALERHEGRKRLHFLSVDVVGVSDATLARHAVKRVLRAVSCDALDASIVASDGKGHTQDVANVLEDVEVSGGDGCLRRGLVEEDLHHVEKLGLRILAAGAGAEATDQAVSSSRACPAEHLNLFAAAHAVWLFQIIGAALCASATHRRMSAWAGVGEAGHTSHLVHSLLQSTSTATRVQRSLRPLIVALFHCVCGPCSIVCVGSMVTSGVQP